MVFIINKIINKLKEKKGFTLIELIVVIAILGILAAILLPQFTGFQDRARSTQALTDAKQVATAMDALEIENGHGSGAFTQAEVEALADKNNSMASTITAFSETTGAFTVTYTFSGSTYTAGRTSYTDSVEIS